MTAVTCLAEPGQGHRAGHDPPGGVIVAATGGDGAPDRHRERIGKPLVLAFSLLSARA